jgi:hypothetical protein
VAAWLWFPQQKDKDYEENIMHDWGDLAAGGRGL